MKVWLVSYEFPPMVGGEGTYTYTLLRALLSLGVEVNLITSSLMQGAYHSDLEDVVHYVPTLGVPALKVFSFSRGAQAKLAELCSRTDVNIIHYTNDYCGFALPKKLAGTRLVSTAHVAYDAERKAVNRHMGTNMRMRISYFISRRPSIVDRLQRRLVSASDGVIAVSQHVASNVVNRHSLQNKSVGVIPNSVDVTRFRPDIDGSDLKREWRVGSSPMVLYLGRWDHFKGLTYLLEAFEEVVRIVPDAKLVLVGWGVLRETLMGMTRRLGLSSSVRLVERLPEEHVPKAYAASDVFVYPSLLEGFGIALLEAMATARPCVGTAAGAIPEIVSNGETGVLVPPRDAHGLSEAISTMLSDSSLARRFGLAGRRRVELEFTPDIMARKTLNFYKKLLD